MAVTAQLVGVTPDKLIYLLTQDVTQDGGAGTTLALTAGSGPNDPAADALDWTDLARALAQLGLSAPQAAGLAMGIGVGVTAGVDPSHYCLVRFEKLTGSQTWLVTATAAGGRVQWNITAGAGAATAIFVIEYHPAAE